MECLFNLPLEGKLHRSSQECSSPLSQNSQLSASKDICILPRIEQVPSPSIGDTVPNLWNLPPEFCLTPLTQKHVKIMLEGLNGLVYFGLFCSCWCSCLLIGKTAYARLNTAILKVCHSIVNSIKFGQSHHLCGDFLNYGIALCCEGPDHLLPRLQTNLHRTVLLGMYPIRESSQ